MASNFAKSMISLVVLTTVGGATALGGLYYWAANPQWSSALIDRGWIKPNAELEKPLRNSDMAAVFAHAQRTGALSSEDSGEQRSDFYTDQGLITLSDSDIELLNQRYRNRVEETRKTAEQTQGQSNSQQEALAESGWGSETSF